MPRSSRSAGERLDLTIIAAILAAVAEAIRTDETEALSLFLVHRYNPVPLIADGIRRRQEIARRN